MNKNQFMKELEKELRNLSPFAKKEILADYEEHFQAGCECGRSEEDICQKLGCPKEIARSYVTEMYLEEAKQATTLGGLFRASLRALFAAVGLGFFNLVFIVGPYFGVIVVLIGLWIATLAVTIGGVAILVVAVQPEYVTTEIWSMLTNCGGSMRIIGGFGGIGTICLGLLLSITMGYVTKLFLLATLWYVRFSLKIVKNNGEK